MTKTTSPQKIKSNTNINTNTDMKLTIKKNTIILIPTPTTVPTKTPTPTPTPTTEPTSTPSSTPSPPQQNICICCHQNLGPGNPRQYCRKTYCDDLCVKCNDYCGGCC